MDLSYTNSCASNSVATEMVYINPSPPMRIGLPAARILERKEGYYIRPRSPVSPTLSGRHVIPISGCRAVRLRCDFVRTKVSDLEVENLQPLDPLSGKHSLPINIVNLQRVPVFDPSVIQTSTFSQLMSLDMLPARGLSEVDFWKLFSKCKDCSNFMTTRTVPYHKCPAPSTSHDSNSNQPVKDQYFLRLLDVHGIGGAAGVPENIFKAIFYACAQCGQYMTQRIMPNHHEDMDLDDYTCINLVNTSSSSIGRKRVVTEFPVLELLS